MVSSTNRFSKMCVVLMWVSQHRISYFTSYELLFLPHPQQLPSGYHAVPTPLCDTVSQPVLPATPAAVRATTSRYFRRLQTPGQKTDPPPPPPPAPPPPRSVGVVLSPAQVWPIGRDDGAITARSPGHLEADSEGARPPRHVTGPRGGGGGGGSTDRETTTPHCVTTFCDTSTAQW